MSEIQPPESEKTVVVSKNNSQEFGSLAWTLLLILFARAFIAEPYKIPSGSMIPTLLVGDHILVAKSAYDLRIPFTDIQFAKVSDPKRGDVIVFKYPNYEQDPRREGDFYIKRLIGVPGDTIQINRGEVSLNSSPVLRKRIRQDESSIETPNYNYNDNFVYLFEENLPGSNKSHLLQHYAADLDMLDDSLSTWRIRSGMECLPIGKSIESGIPDSRLMNQICEFTVPEDHYFVMGDNRDDSSDGRAWGFVPRTLLKGKALFVWLPCKDQQSPGLKVMCFPFSGVPEPVESYIFSGEGESGGPLIRWKRFGLRII